MLVCNRCKSEHVNKHDSPKGKQRYRCKDCGKTFFEKSIDLIRHPKRRAIHLLIEGYDPKEIAEHLGMSDKTIINYRDKYLRNLKSIIPNFAFESPHTIDYFDYPDGYHDEARSWIKEDFKLREYIKEKAPFKKKS